MSGPPAGEYPSIGALTAAFIYARLHGARQLHASHYSGGDLAVRQDKSVG